MTSVPGHKYFEVNKNVPKERENVLSTSPGRDDQLFHRMTKEDG